MRITTLSVILMTTVSAAAYAQTPAPTPTVPSAQEGSVMTRPDTVISGQDVKMPSGAAAPTQPGVYSQSGGAGAIPAMPLEIKSVNGISYVTGGVSDEEMAELKMKDHDFNMQLLMAGVGGAYVSEAQIRVLDDKGGEVMPAIHGAGPYFYANLKPGKYVIEVTTKQGVTKTVDVSAPAMGSVKPILRVAE